MKFLHFLVFLLLLGAINRPCPCPQPCPNDP